MMKLDIKLDPVNDGAVVSEKSFIRKGRGGLIISTTGGCRSVVGTDMLELMGNMVDVAGIERIGTTPFVMLYNVDKVIDSEDGDFFIGTVLIVKRDEDKMLKPLSSYEFSKAAKEFESRLVTVMCDGQAFSAYEL